MKKKLVLLVVLTFIASILAVGCQNAAQRPLDPNQNNIQNNTTPESELRAMAERLEDLAEEVRGVDDASVIISEMSNMDTGLGNNAGNNNIIPNTGAGTGTGDNNMGSTGLRNDTRNNNMGNAGLRDNTRDNVVEDTIPRTDANENMGNPNPNMNNGTSGTNGTNGTIDRTDRMDRTNDGGLTGITENISNRFTNNNMNNTTNNTRGLVVLVGIELEDNYKNNAANADTIQREVANKIKASDSRISQVYVTTDESMVKRIEDVADDVEKGGGALRTLRNEINKIYRELINQGPAF